MTLPLLTTSSIRCFRKCQKLYEYKYVKCVRPKKNAVPLDFGIAVHAGLEKYWETGDAGKALEGCHTALAEGDLEPQEQAKVLAAMTAYCQKWDASRHLWEVVSVEEEFLFDRKYAGKMDSIARHTMTGELYIIEHKTVGKDVEDPGDPYWVRLSYDLQIALYMAAVERIYGERPRVLYDVIRKPTIRLKKSESVAEFGKRVLSEYNQNPQRWFFRKEIHTDANVLNEVIDHAEETWDMIQEGKFHKNEYQCSVGFMTCEYINVCAGLESLSSDKFEEVPVAHPELSDTVNSGKAHAVAEALETEMEKENGKWKI